MTDNHHQSPQGKPSAEDRVEGSVSPVRYDARVWYAGVVVVLSSYALVFLHRAPRQAAGD